MQKRAKPEQVMKETHFTICITVATYATDS